MGDDLLQFAVRVQAVAEVVLKAVALPEPLSTRTLLLQRCLWKKARLLDLHLNAADAGRTHVQRLQPLYQARHRAVRLGFRIAARTRLTERNPI